MNVTYDRAVVEALGQFWLGLQRENLNTAKEAQAVWFQAARAVATLHQGWIEETLRRVEAMLTRRDEPPKPTDLMIEARFMAQQAAHVYREQTNISLKAQKELARLVAQRAEQNFDEVRSLAA